MSDDAGLPYASRCVPSQACRRRAPGSGRSAPAARRRAGAGLVPRRAAAGSPRARPAGYAAGAWLPAGGSDARCGLTISALVLANQLHGADYHPVDDLVFFLAIVGGPAAAGAAVSLRAAQVDRLERLQAELTAQQEVEVRAARLEEQVSDRAGRCTRGSRSASRRSRSTPRVHSAPADSRCADGSSRTRRAACSTSSAPRSGRSARTRAAPVRDRSARRGAAGDGGPRGRLADRAASRHGLGPTSCSPPPSARPSPSRPSSPPPPAGPLWLNVLAAAASWRRRSSYAGPTLSSRSSAFSLAGVLMSSWLTPLPATVTGVALLLVVFYSVGAWCRGWWWVAGWVLALVGALAMEAVSGLDDDADPGDGAWIVVVLTVGAVAVGRVTAGWQERLRRTEVVVGELAARRGAAVRLARRPGAPGARQPAARHRGARDDRGLPAGRRAPRVRLGPRAGAAHDRRHRRGEPHRAPGRPGRHRDAASTRSSAHASPRWDDASASTSRWSPCADGRDRTRRATWPSAWSARRSSTSPGTPRGLGSGARAAPRAGARGRGRRRRPVRSARRDRRRSRPDGPARRRRRRGRPGSTGARAPRAGSSSAPTSRGDAVTSILLVDDQELVRTGLRMILSAEPDLDVVGEAADGAAAVERSTRWSPTWSSWTSACRASTASRRRDGSPRAAARPAW